jgi:hypothetical protein
MYTLRGMISSSKQLAWINAEKARYYQIYLDQDLFGDWTLIKVWGGVGSNRGGIACSGVASLKAGMDEIEHISRRRSKRGYRRIASP